MAKEAKGKNSTVFYHEWLELLEDFTDEEAGQLMKAVLLFDRDGIKTTFKDRAMRSVFKQMISVTSRNRARYDISCQKKAEYYRKKSEKNETKVQSTTEHYSAVTDNDNDNENDNENVNVNVNEDDDVNDNDAIQPHHLPELDAAPIDLIIRHWNARTITRPIQTFGPVSARANNVRLCINGDLDQFIDTIKHLDEQQFLMRQFMDKGRQITFDWFVKPENYQKVAEGNYAEEWKEAESDGYAVDW